jgi:hypothetical protein
MRLKILDAFIIAANLLGHTPPPKAHCSYIQGHDEMAGKAPAEKP